MKKEYSEELLDLLKRVKGKRSRVIIDHILEHGIITTEELEAYGYKHPPRAARAVREQGIPLKTVYVKSSDGRRIAAYVLGDVSEVKMDRIEGRTIIPKSLKKELIQQSGSKCSICCVAFEETMLQVDHRVPYEITGNQYEGQWNPADYMLLCGSCQRSKSWSCEQCDNWATQKDESICRECYWAYPESYSHLCQTDIRRMDIAWRGEETKDYTLSESTPIPRVWMRESSSRVSYAST